MGEPIQSTFMQMHSAIVIFVVMMAWGIYIYFVSTNDRIQIPISLLGMWLFSQFPCFRESISRLRQSYLA